MKLRTYIARLILLAAVLFSSPLLKAQYVFTQLDLLGSTRGGSVSIAGSNVLITYLDSSNNPTSFLYSGSKYTLIDDILAGNKTLAEGTDGISIVGAIEDSSKVGHGFLYTGGQFTTITFPSARHTAAVAVSGSNVVGTYQDANNIGHGFLYNGGAYTPITFPSAFKTGVSAISGSNIVGTYEDTGLISHGFIYNGGTYTPINFPGATKTGVGAVDGNNILGVYQLSSTTQSGNGFLYNSGAFTPISYPGSKETVLSGVSGNNVVGTYINDFNGELGNGYTNFEAIPQGFIYSISGQTYTTLNVPGARRTAITGVSGNNIVGIYEDINFVYHGFLAAPASKTLSLSGSLAFGNVTENTMTTSTLTITNTGNSPVTVSSITYPAGFSGSFSGSVAPGSAQKVTVTFAPISVTSYGGTISVASNATGSPNTIAVSGAGIAAVPAIVGPAPPMTFSQWTTQYALVGGSTATLQNDGVPNLLKYLYDINPTVPLSASDRAALPTVSMSTVNGTQYLMLTYRQNASLSGVTVNLQTSTDLQTWTTVTPDIAMQVGTDPLTSDPIVKEGVVATGSTQFIRLNVTSP